MLLEILVLFALFAFRGTNKVGEVALALPSLSLSLLFAAYGSVITVLSGVVRLPFWTILSVMKLSTLIVRGLYILTVTMLWYLVWTPVRLLLVCVWLLVRYGLPFALLAASGFVITNVLISALRGQPVSVGVAFMNLTSGKACPF